MCLAAGQFRASTKRLEVFSAKLRIPRELRGLFSVSPLCLCASVVGLLSSSAKLRAAPRTPRSLETGIRHSPFGIRARSLRVLRVFSP